MNSPGDDRARRPKAPRSVPLARLDDRSGPHERSWAFDDPVAQLRIESIDGVIDGLAAAEAEANAGRWVVLAMAYEAAPAFDPAMQTHAVPPDGTPFLWWAAFDHPSDAGALPITPSAVRSRLRAANVLEYPEAVEAIRGEIALGNVYQVNTTDRFHGTYDGDPIDLYHGLVGVQRCAYGAYLDMGTRVIASASPELFVQWTGDTLTCRPMKGTAPRRARPDADAAAAAELLASVKDRAENVMIVDLLRNDLSRLAILGSVQVPHLFTLERYETVWQLTSTVTATVPATTTLVEVMTALFPCGSVTGAPKIAAMRVIDRLEAEPRGVYCGAIGLLAPPGADAPRASFSVPIRTAVVDPVNRTFVYGAGGGITWSSDPSAEDEEVRVKARILQRSRRQFDLLDTLRCDERGVVHLDDHLDRLSASAAWFDVPLDRAAVADELAALPPTAAPYRVRVLVSLDGQVTIESEPLVESPIPVRLAVDVVAIDADDPFCCHKTTWRRHYIEARRRHPAADDVLLVNNDGHVVESTTANLLYRIGDEWFTPPLTDGGLPGIGRQRAVNAGDAVERSLPIDELGEVDELVLINDLRGRRPADLTNAP